MPRIYVASLADYNNGTLHGVWIDIDDCAEPDDVHERITAMLQSSPLAADECGVCRIDRGDHRAIMASLPPDSVRHGFRPVDAPEEFAIHDHEGFGAYSPGEYAWISNVVTIGALIDELGAPFLAWLDADTQNVDPSHGIDGVLDRDEIRDRYADEIHNGGQQYTSAADFVSEYVRDVGQIDDATPYAEYIDWADVWRDQYEPCGWVIVDGYVFSPAP